MSYGTKILNAAANTRFLTVTNASPKYHEAVNVYYVIY